jgi:hypothetical protein
MLLNADLAPAYALKDLGMLIVSIDTGSRVNRLPLCSKEYFADQATQTVLMSGRAGTSWPRKGSPLPGCRSLTRRQRSVNTSRIMRSPYHHAQFGTLTYHPSPQSRGLQESNVPQLGTPRRQDLVLIHLGSYQHPWDRESRFRQLHAAPLGDYASAKDEQ